MLLLITIGLVLVGAVSLVIGFVTNSLGPIYLSIACSVVAGVVLVVFSRMSRRRATAEAPAAGPAKAGAGSPSAGESPPTPAPAWSAPAGREPAATEQVPVPASGYGRVADAGTAGSTAGAGGAVATLDDEGGEGAGVELGFPIEDYDDLRVNEILPLLSELDLDELDLVREREEQGKDRRAVIRRVDELIEELELEEEQAAPPPAAPSRAPAPAGAPARDSALAGASTAWAADDFPLPNYDSLSVEEILARLEDLDDEELDMVAEREEQGQGRAAILDHIDAMFEPEEQGAAVPEAPPAAPAPAGRQASTASGRQAPTAAAAKKAAKAPAGTPATKAPAKKAAKAPAGTPATKAPAKRAAKAPAGTPATKAPAKRAAKAPAGKQTATAPAKKAAGTKKR